MGRGVASCGGLSQCVPRFLTLHHFHFASADLSQSVQKVSATAGTGRAQKHPPCLQAGCSFFGGLLRLPCFLGFLSKPSAFPHCGKKITHCGCCLLAPGGAPSLSQPLFSKAWFTAKPFCQHCPLPFAPQLNYFVPFLLCRCRGILYGQRSRIVRWPQSMCAKISYTSPFSLCIS